MTSIAAGRLQSGDIIDLPTTLSGTVTDVDRRPAGLVRFTLSTPQGDVTVTHHEDAKFEVREILGAERRS